MDPIPSWLNDAVQAAGMAAVYNADDWKVIVDNAPPPIEFAYPA